MNDSTVYCQSREVTEAKFSAENLARPLVQVVPQPTFRTEKDIGAKNPETTAVSGFVMPVFKVKLKRYHFPKTTFGEDLNYISEQYWVEKAIII